VGIGPQRLEGGITAALRLARFNCLAAANSAAANKEFTGFPIPAAAGLIASLTLFMLFLDEHERTPGAGKWVLPPLMLFLAWMMFSKFKYPSFKGLSWRSTRSLPKFIAILIVAVVTVLNFEWMPFILFLSYLLYGFLRPFLSREMKRDIEENDDDDESDLQQKPQPAPVKPQDTP
jgi:CDP-diacylglycerol--serine O-phosphatidyltransferase